MKCLIKIYSGQDFLFANWSAKGRMSASERFKELRSRLGLTTRAMAAGLDVSQSVISDWESGRRPVRKTNAMALQLLYNVSWEWLMGGEGNMWIQAKDLGIPRQVVEVPILNGLPEWDSEGRVLSTGDERYPFSDAFIRSALKMAGAGTVDHLFATVISGNSMQPTLLNGDLVLVNTALELRKNPKNAALHLVRKDKFAKEIRAKRVYSHPGALSFGSDNPNFHAIPIPLEGIELPDLILGQILWYGRHIQALSSEGEDW